MSRYTLHHCSRDSLQRTHSSVECCWVGELLPFHAALMGIRHNRQEHWTDTPVIQVELTTARAQLQVGCVYSTVYGDKTANLCRGITSNTLLHTHA